MLKHNKEDQTKKLKHNEAMKKHNIKKRTKKNLEYYDKFVILLWKMADFEKQKDDPADPDGVELTEKLEKIVNETKEKSGQLSINKYIIYLFEQLYNNRY